MIEFLPIGLAYSCFNTSVLFGPAVKDYDLGWQDEGFFTFRGYRFFEIKLFEGLDRGFLGIRILCWFMTSAFIASRVL